MLMKTKCRACLLVLGLASVAVLMMVLAGGSSSQLFSSQGPSRDYQLLARPTYKLDPRWPRYPELLTGDVFAVAVDPYAGVVYVAQRGERAFIYLYSLVRRKQKRSTLSCQSLFWKILYSKYCHQIHYFLFVCLLVFINIIN